MAEEILNPVETLSAEEARDEIIQQYPAKVARKRAKHIVVNKLSEDGCVPEIESNVRFCPAGCAGYPEASVGSTIGWSVTGILTDAAMRPRPCIYFWSASLIERA